jgi:hypothetical protein
MEPVLKNLPEIRKKSNHGRTSPPCGTGKRSGLFIV